MDIRTTTTADGRTVAWKAYGASDQSAPVVINIQGSGLEAGFEETVNAKACQDLSVRGLAISLPGCGYSDQKPGRIVKDWPLDDLAAVLEAEKTDRFHTSTKRSVIEVHAAVFGKQHKTRALIGE